MRHGLSPGDPVVVEFYDGGSSVGTVVHVPDRHGHDALVFVDGRLTPSWRSLRRIRTSIAA